MSGDYFAWLTIEWHHNRLARLERQRVVLSHRLTLIIQQIHTQLPIAFVGLAYSCENRYVELVACSVAQQFDEKISKPDKNLTESADLTDDI
jgi:hypothetical protein